MRQLPRGGALALLLLTLITRLPALAHPRYFNDEPVYSIVAIEILEGGRPYASAVERKPPLLFWAYAAILGLVGRYNAIGLHMVAVLWVLATMAGLYAIGRTLFDPIVGWWAALFYCVYQAWLSFSNLAFNGELMMNLPIVWALLLAVRPARSRLRPELLLAGVLLSVAFLLKQPAAIAAVPVGLYLLQPGYRRNRDLTPRDALLHATWLTLGFFGTLGLVALILQAQGILGDAYYWTILDHDIPFVAWKAGLVTSLAFVAFGWPMVRAALGSLGALRNEGSGPWRGRHPELVAFTLLLLGSVVGTLASGQFLQHYFIQLIPPLALLAAPVWARPRNGRRGLLDRVFSRRVLQGWLAASTLVFLVSHTVGLASRREITDVGRFLRAHSTPEDRILVWGATTMPYVDAQRRPASRYFLFPPLTGFTFGWPQNQPMPDTRYRIVPGAWETFQREMDQQPPRFIVDVTAVRSPDSQYSMHRFPALWAMVERDFRLVERASAGWIYQRVD